jgi:hypothetical protein
MIINLLIQFNFMEDKILVSPDTKMAWIYIPGNLDHLGDVFKNLLWKQLNQNAVRKSFVILDDPLIRWINATVLDFNQQKPVQNSGLHPNTLIDYVLKNKIIANPNIVPQNKLIQQIVQEYKFGSIIYFQKDWNLGYLLNHFLHDNNIANNLNNSMVNQQEISEQAKELSDFIFQDINRPYLNKILKYLEQDYDFYKSTQFYAR